jgi:hypothetical protein
MTGPIIVASLTYVLMLAAMYWHRMRRFHATVMVSIIIFDVCMPFYLVATHDWKQRLLIDGDILSFGVWMHFGLIITLYVLYVIQVQAGLRVWRGVKSGLDAEEVASNRSDHRAQGMGILLARGLVISTGAILADPVAVLM